MKKNTIGSLFFLLVFCFCLTFVVCEHTSGPESMTSLDALTFVSSIKFGINISASLDAFPDPQFGITDFTETAWGNPPINQALLNSIAAEGFDIVRIPITWIAFIGDAPEYKVSEDRLRRVAEVVNMAHRAGFKAIINIHHDATPLSPFKDFGFLQVDKAAANEEAEKEIAGMLQAVLRQIAEYFVNYGDYLIFEIFNEAASLNVPTPQRELEIINDWNKIFVDTVRNTGGNNISRFLIVKGFAAKAEYTIDTLIIPPDPRNSVNKLIVSFHYWEPRGLTHDKLSTWTNTDKSAIDKTFDEFKNKFIDMGIPVILGEFGLRYNASIENIQKDYLSYIVGAAHRRGIPSLYWDGGIIDDGFLLFDRNTTLVFPFMESYLQTMKDALR